MKSSASGYQSVWTTIVRGQMPACEPAEDEAAGSSVPVPAEEVLADDAPVDGGLELQAAARVATATPPMMAAFNLSCATGGCSFERSGVYGLSSCRGRGRTRATLRRRGGR